MKTLFLKSLFLAVALLAMTADAQAQHAAPLLSEGIDSPLDPCRSPAQTQGVMSIMQVKGPGSMSGFVKALAAHDQWFADQGYKNRVFTAPILVAQEFANNLGDYPGDNVTLSRSFVVTFNLNRLDSGFHGKDAAWNAYTAKNKGYLFVKQSLLVCYPIAQIPQPRLD